NTADDSKTNEYNDIDDSETNKYNDIDDSETNEYNSIDDNYYKEVYRCSIDIVDIENVNMNAEVITLKEEKLFFNFNNAEQQIRSYAEFKEFKTKLDQ
ncbi:12609_t:CDS:2, partial [Cetraspora pellucida]